jgi:hypothetical protein
VTRCISNYSAFVLVDMNLENDRNPCSVEENKYVPLSDDRGWLSTRYLRCEGHCSARHVRVLPIREYVSVCFVFVPLKCNFPGLNSFFKYLPKCRTPPSHASNEGGGRNPQDVVGAGKGKVPLRIAFRARERGRGVVLRVP